MKNLLLLVLCIALFACSKESKETINAKQVIKKSIKFHGGSAYDSTEITYRFRDYQYKLIQNNGLYQYQRIKKDSNEVVIKDILTNTGLKRFRNEETVLLNPKDSAAYANSVNSVHYFALLPYGLDNPAVISELKAKDTINSKTYHTIKITFKKDGGGTDYDDVFYYWFDQDDYSMDYFAYRYHTEGGGIRFRSVTNQHKEKGILFQDYNNYKADLGTPLQKLPDLYESGELELLSQIDLEFHYD